MDRASATTNLQARQRRAFQAIVRWLFRVVVTLAAVLWLVAIGGGLRLELVGLALAVSGFAVCAAITRQTLSAGKVTVSLLLMFAPMFLIASGISVFFRDGVYLIVLATIITTFTGSMVASVRLALWLAGGGIIAFLVFTGLAKQGVFDALYGPAQGIGDYLTPLIMVAGLSFLAMIAYILNQTLVDSLAEAEQRRQLAETASQEQAATLVKVQQQAADQERLLNLVRDLETPVIPLLEGVLVLPVVGHLDTQRINALTASLLDEVAQRRAHTVIIDLTGVSLIDTGTANHLGQLAQGVQLLGAEVMLTGIRAEVAQTLVTLGVSLRSIKTAASLQAGISQVSRELNHGL